jgi:hypothetical protein
VRAIALPAPEEPAHAREALLSEDPFAELRALADAYPRVVAPFGMQQGGLPADASRNASEEIYRRQGAFYRAPEPIPAGVIEAIVAEAFGLAGGIDAQPPELVDPLASALTAALASAVAAGDAELALLFSWTRAEAELREILTLGFGARGPRQQLAKFVTFRLRAKWRARLLDAQADFLGDVLAYVSKREQIQDHVDDEIGKIQADHPGEPLWLIGHSLGGVIAFEYCQSGRRDVERLVTVGSQVGLLAELGALTTGAFGASGRIAAPPRTGTWRNVYDPDDMLSFLADPVFEGVTDHAVDTGVPFPWSHSEYWSCDAAYKAIVV